MKTDHEITSPGTCYHFCFFLEVTECLLNPFRLSWCNTQPPQVNICPVDEVIFPFASLLSVPVQPEVLAPASHPDCYSTGGRAGGMAITAWKWYCFPPGEGNYFSRRN